MSILGLARPELLAMAPYSSLLSRAAIAPATSTFLRIEGEPLCGMRPASSVLSSSTLR